jgi:hypothetical protein
MRIKSIPSQAIIPGGSCDFVADLLLRIRSIRNRCAVPGWAIGVGVRIDSLHC